MAASHIDQSSSQSRSHVVLLSIPDESLGDLNHILDRLRFHRGWEPQVFSASSRESASQVAERCGTVLRQNLLSQESALTSSNFRYPATEREVSLLIPDREDTTGRNEDTGSQDSAEIMASPPRLTLRDKLRLRRMAAHSR